MIVHTDQRGMSDCDICSSTPTICLFGDAHGAVTVWELAYRSATAPWWHSPFGMLCNPVYILYTSGMVSCISCSIIRCKMGFNDNGNWLTTIRLSTAKLEYSSFSAGDNFKNWHISWNMWHHTWGLKFTVVHDASSPPLRPTRDPAPLKFTSKSLYLCTVIDGTRQYPPSTHSVTAR